MFFGSGIRPLGFGYSSINGKMVAMNLRRKLLLSLSIFVFFAVGAAQVPTPAPTVDTTTRPVEKQVRRTYAFEADGVYFSNEFAGARLNNVERDETGRYVVTILPENAPINPSPWYAFTVRSDRKKEIRIKLVYPEFSRHRYAPQVSKDGRKWKYLAKQYITEEERGTAASGPGSLPKSITMRLKVGRKPLWVSAQELQDSSRVYAWMDKLSRKHRLRIQPFGKSKEGRPLKVMQIGNSGSKNMMLVISRQHPPEVTGYFAMQAFVEELLDDSRLAKDFRRDWNIFVIPLMNPDGVDEGHWRHNAGGVDLNRDWTVFNQPEGLAVSNFIKQQEAATGGKFYFGIDFHSTWNDIYYPMAKGIDGNMPNLVHDWLENIRKEIKGYKPNIEPNRRLEPAIVSRNYFLRSHGMEAIVFEIGDNTPRKFIRKKGRVGAKELMKLMTERIKGAERPASKPASGRAAMFLQAPPHSAF